MFVTSSLISNDRYLIENDLALYHFNWAPGGVNMLCNSFNLCCRCLRIFNIYRLNWLTFAASLSVMKH